MTRLPRSILWIVCLGMSAGCNGDNADSADHCENGIQDSDETGIDCGGSCTECENGLGCAAPGDCAGGLCQENLCFAKATDCTIAGVQTEPGSNWFDSYSADGRCYCDSTFDHRIGEKSVETRRGTRTVREICETIGPGPGREGNPVYNDIQCGNGPANDAGDEDWCPGRVDQGREGCCTVGPRWNLDALQ